MQKTCKDDEVYGVFFQFGGDCIAEAVDIIMVFIGDNRGGDVVLDSPRYACNVSFAANNHLYFCV